MIALIPKPLLVAAIAILAALLTVVSFANLGLHSDLKRTQKRLDKANADLTATTSLALACRASVTALKTQSSQLTAATNAALEQARSRAAVRETTIAALRARPTPPPATDCAASNDLINELLTNAPLTR